MPGYEIRFSQINGGRLDARVGLWSNGLNFASVNIPQLSLRRTPRSEGTIPCQN